MSFVFTKVHLMCVIFLTATVPALKFNPVDEGRNTTFAIGQSDDVGESPWCRWFSRASWCQHSSSRRRKNVHIMLQNTFHSADNCNTASIASTITIYGDDDVIQEFKCYDTVDDGTPGEYKTMFFCGRAMNNNAEFELLAGPCDLPYSSSGYYQGSGYTSSGGQLINKGYGKNHAITASNSDLLPRTLRYMQALTGDCLEVGTGSSGTKGKVKSYVRGFDATAFGTVTQPAGSYFRGAMMCGARTYGQIHVLAYEASLAVTNANNLLDLTPVEYIVRILGRGSTASTIRRTALGSNVADYRVQLIKLSPPMTIRFAFAMYDTVGGNADKDIWFCEKNPCTPTTHIGRMQPQQPFPYGFGLKRQRDGVTEALPACGSAYTIPGDTALGTPTAHNNAGCIDPSVSDTPTTKANFLQYSMLALYGVPGVSINPTQVRRYRHDVTFANHR